MTLPGGLTWGAVPRLFDELGVVEEEYAARTSSKDLAPWRYDPVGFDVAMGRNPTDYQQEIMRSVVQNRYTVVRGCHGAGKEHIAGSLAVWGATVPGMLVLVISATERQVIGQTMREVRAAFRAAAKHHGIGGQALAGSIRIAGEDRIIALTGGSVVDALTGWHDVKGVLVIISEGQGERLEDTAYDAAIGIASDAESRVLALGNPVRPSGRFFDINRKPHWNAIKVSAFDTPNVKAGAVVLPGFPAPGWPAEVAREYGGTTSPYYVSRVLAEFPPQGESALFREDYWNAAVSRGPTVAPGIHREAVRFAVVPGSIRSPVFGSRPRATLAVDVAGAGEDLTAEVVRVGWCIWQLRRWREPDSMRNAERIFSEAEGLIREGFAVSLVVDEIGEGKGVHDKLLRMIHRLQWIELVPGGLEPRTYTYSATLLGYKGSRQAKDPSRYVNARAEAFDFLATVSSEGDLVLAPHLDPELLGDLREELLALEGIYGTDDKLMIVGKETIRSALGRSPDLGDAAAMAFWPSAPRSARNRKKARVF